MDKLITVIVKPGHTFQGVTYYEPTKFNVTPEYARHLVETGIVTVQPPPYAVRKRLRDATLRVGRDGFRCRYCGCVNAARRKTCNGCGETLAKDAAHAS